VNPWMLARSVLDAPSWFSFQLPSAPFARTSFPRHPCPSNFLLVAIMKCIFILLAIGIIGGCNSDNDDDYSSVRVRVKNSTDRTITVHYQTEKWLVLALVLRDETVTVEPVQEMSFTHYYNGIPDIHVTGVGVDVWFNSLLYRDDRFTLRQSDVVEGDG